MTARQDKAKQLEAQKRNRWWLDEKLADARITKSYLAEQLKLNPSSFSRSLHGTRAWSAEELSMMSRVLHVDTNELYHMMGVREPYGSSERKVKVGQKITAAGDLVSLRAAERDTVPVPPSVPAKIAAAYCDVGGPTGNSWYDGWTVYYLPAEQVDRRAVGRLSVVEVEQGLRIGFLQQGTRPDQFSLVRFPSGREDDDMPVLSASPVLWIRCQP